MPRIQDRTRNTKDARLRCQGSTSKLHLSGSDSALTSALISTAWPGAQSRCSQQASRRHCQSSDYFCKQLQRLPEIALVSSLTDSCWWLCWVRRPSSVIYPEARNLQMSESLPFLSDCTFQGSSQWRRAGIFLSPRPCWPVQSLWRDFLAPLAATSPETRGDNAWMAKRRSGRTLSRSSFVVHTIGWNASSTSPVL